ncbi:hypothetical protein N9W34_06740, partial [Rickettsiales bacterium]|nr:hypothetical protein [Rickettsiales bacterium]
TNLNGDLEKADKLLLFDQEIGGFFRKFSTMAKHIDAIETKYKKFNWEIKYKGAQPGFIIKNDKKEPICVLKIEGSDLEKDDEKRSVNCSSVLTSTILRTLTSDEKKEAVAEEKLVKIGDQVFLESKYLEGGFEEKEKGYEFNNLLLDNQEGLNLLARLSLIGYFDLNEQNIGTTKINEEDQVAILDFGSGLSFHLPDEEYGDVYDFFNKQIRHENYKIPTERLYRLYEDLTDENYQKFQESVKQERINFDKKKGELKTELEGKCDELQKVYGEDVEIRVLRKNDNDEGILLKDAPDEIIKIMDQRLQELEQFALTMTLQHSLEVIKKSGDYTEEKAIEDIEDVFKKHPEMAIDKIRWISSISDGNEYKEEKLTFAEKAEVYKCTEVLGIIEEYKSKSSSDEGQKLSVEGQQFSPRPSTEGRDNSFESVRSGEGEEEVTLEEDNKVEENSSGVIVESALSEAGEESVSGYIGEEPSTSSTRQVSEEEKIASQVDDLSNPEIETIASEEQDPDEWLKNPPGFPLPSPIEELPITEHDVREQGFVDNIRQEQDIGFKKISNTPAYDPPLPPSQTIDFDEKISILQKETDAAISELSELLDKIDDDIYADMPGLFYEDKDMKNEAEIDKSNRYKLTAPAREEYYTRTPKQSPALNEAVTIPVDLGEIPKIEESEECEFEEATKSSWKKFTEKFENAKESFASRFKADNGERGR